MVTPPYSHYSLLDFKHGSRALLTWGSEVENQDSLIFEFAWDVCHKVKAVSPCRLVLETFDPAYVRLEVGWVAAHAAATGFPQGA